MDCSPCQPNKKITSISTITCTPVCLASSFGVSTTVNVSTYVYLSTYNSYISTTINNTYSGTDFYFSTTYNNTTYYIPSSINVNISSSAVALSTYVMNPGFNINLSSFVTLSTYVLNPGFNINISSSSAVLSTFITNNCVPVCISSPSVFSTLIINPGISTFIVNPISTFVTNPINVNISSSVALSTFVVNPGFNVNLSSFVTLSTFVTNPINVNISSSGVLSTFVVNPISTFVTNPINVNISSSLVLSTFVTNPIDVNISSSGVISTFLVNSNITIANQVSDVFNRLYVTSPTLTLGSDNAFTPQYEITDYHSTGSGFVSTITISTMTILQASNNGGGRAVRQTHEYQLYQPGTSHLVQFSWVPQFLGTFDNSVAVRAGIYDDYRDKNTPAGTTGANALFVSSIYGGVGQETNQPSMGHYFELSGNSWFVVEKYNSPDNIQNVTRVAQSNWNVNTFSSNYGPNPSGYILGISTPSLLFVERQWLGVGNVRMGAFYNSLYTICHVFKNRTYNQAYTHLNKLPIRYEIEKVSGGSPNPATMASICCSSQIGGQYTAYGRIYSLPANITYATTRIGLNSLRPILLIRLQQQYCRATVKIKSLDILSIDNAQGAYSLLLNPTLNGGAVTWTPMPNPGSMIEYAYFPDGSTSTRTVTGGRCLRSGYFTGRLEESDSLGVDELLTAQSICSDIHGVPDIVCLAMVSYTANTDVTANFRWIEVV